MKVKKKLGKKITADGNKKMLKCTEYIVIVTNHELYNYCRVCARDDLPQKKNYKTLKKNPHLKKDFFTGTVAWDVSRWSKKCK